MNRNGMFKAVICSDTEEYSFPFIKEKFLFFKNFILAGLISLMVFLIFNPPIRFSKLEISFEPYRIKEKVDSFGTNVLHRVVIDGKVGVLNILIRNGFNLNLTDKYGWTALHWANFLGKTQMVKTLIENGARTDIESTKGWFIFKKGSVPADVRK